MLEQLEAVAASERKAKEDRVNAERQVELAAWRERRREQLEKLIEVQTVQQYLLVVYIHDVLLSYVCRRFLPFLSNGPVATHDACW